MSLGPIPDPATLPRDLAPIARKARALRRLEARVASLRLELYDSMRFAMSDGRGAPTTARAAGMATHSAQRIRKRTD